MTFGRLVNKWRIFRRPLQVRLKNVGKVFLCATRLHNFCINERLLDDDFDDDDDDDDPPNPKAVSGHEEQNPIRFVPSTVAVASVQGNSVIRDFLVDEIKSNALSRPAHNLQRNKDAAS
jgi:hypothetical protein